MQKENVAVFDYRFYTVYIYTDNKSIKRLYNNKFFYTKFLQTKRIRTGIKYAAT